MDDFDHPGMAAIIRGQYIYVAEVPWVVVYDDSGRAIPSEALSIDIGSAWRGGVLDETAAAKIFQEAFAAWEFEMAPSGVEAAVKTKISKKLPTCVVIRQEEAVKAVYWADEYIDAAWKRREERNGAIWEERRSQASKNSAVGLDAGPRALVVKNRIALVIGGAQSFEEDIIQGLAASGALVFIAEPGAAKAEALARRINTEEKRLAAVPLSVNGSDEASVEAMFKTVAETAGGLDICITCAEAFQAGGVLEQDPRDFEFVTGVNYTGFFIMVKQAGRLLRRQHRTAPGWKTDIIQINAHAWIEGAHKNGAYAGSKSGSIGLMASFALELAEYNIKINAICPGNYFGSPLWSDPEKGLFAQHLAGGKTPASKSLAEARAYYEAKVPLKRGCTGADIMRAVYYIVEQEYETGQVLPVTGGQFTPR